MEENNNLNENEVNNVEPEVTTENTTSVASEVPEAPVTPEVQPDPVVASVPEVDSTPKPAEPVEPIEPFSSAPVAPANQEEKKKGSKAPIIIVIILLLIALGVGLFFLLGNGNKTNKDEKTVTTEKKTVKSDFKLTGNDLEEFDLQFLRIENKKENIVYSPLSIKYALAMLNEGAEGDTKEQIKALIGDYKAKKYINSKNMSIANAFFIKNTAASQIVDTFKTTLKDKYDAEIITDEFKDPYKINNWVKEKTLGLIPKALDGIDEEDIYYIVNALAIDMEWQNYIVQPGLLQPKAGEFTSFVIYSHTNIGWQVQENEIAGNFNGKENSIKTLEIGASVNNFDPIKKYGSEDKYKKVIRDYYEKCYKENPVEAGEDYVVDIDEDVKNAYEAVTSITGDVKMSTDFLVYNDDDVKVFAKNLKKYDGTTLQYVGIMPIKEDLSTFISNTGSEKIKEYVKGLKEIKRDSFEDGYITLIKGSVPKFKYDYDLDLKGDLKKLGITDVFDATKAKLTKLTKEQSYISKAIHKATIEFSEYGIKAGAVTIGGGAGNLNGLCHYSEEIPTKKIDLTFDKPYLYIIRDIDSGEVWFTGQVYNPTEYKDL